MASFNWRDELRIGIPEVDVQHEALVALASEVHQKMASGSPGLLGAMDTLIENTRSHFIAEEGFMLAGGYPGFDDHRAEHRRLLDQFGTLRQDLAAGHTTGSESLATLIHILTEQHMLFSDKAMGQFLTRASRSGIL